MHFKGELLGSDHDVAVREPQLVMVRPDLQQQVCLLFLGGTTRSTSSSSSLRLFRAPASACFKFACDMSSEPAAAIHERMEVAADE